MKMQGETREPGKLITICLTVTYASIEKILDFKIQEGKKDFPEFKIF
jgi:hypothetical protein